MCTFCAREIDDFDTKLKIEAARLDFQSFWCEPLERTHDEHSVRPKIEDNGPELQKLRSVEVLYTKSPKPGLGRRAPGARALVYVRSSLH